MASKAGEEKIFQQADDILGLVEKYQADFKLVVAARTSAGIQMKEGSVPDSDKIKSVQGTFYADNSILLAN